MYCGMLLGGSGLHAVHSLIFLTKSRVNFKSLSRCLLKFKYMFLLDFINV